MSGIDLAWIASVTGARRARRAARIQSLWAGYGELVRVELDDGRTAVVKWARPPAGAQDASARRKRRSFDVETAFYRSLAPRCDDACRVPALLGARGDGDEWLLVLEDLDAAGFTGRTDEATGPQLDRVLAWLASFHARFLGERPDGVWPTGSYWHLDTRRDELSAIDDPLLRFNAPLLAARLTGARYQTLIHGDAKDANFCFSPTSVAAVDFQYTGAAPGIVDVAYLLYGRTDEPAHGIDDARLDLYFTHLRAALPVDVDADALEREWRALYITARLDFCRFLAGWRPAMWAGDARGQRFVRSYLETRSQI